jgi:GGDEF domain-containing protein
MVAALLGEQGITWSIGLGASDQQLLLQQASSLARRVISATRQPVRIGGIELSHAASVGICMAEPGEPPSVMIENADMAMDRAKGLGRGASPSLNQPCG